MSNRSLDEHRQAHVETGGIDVTEATGTVLFDGLAPDAHSTAETADSAPFAPDDLPVEREDGVRVRLPPSSVGAVRVRTATE